MSDGELYRVLYIDGDGYEQLTEALPHDAAHSRARDLDAGGLAVGSVMTASDAGAYMQDRYSPAYRGVTVPDGLRADGRPYAVYEAWKRGVDAELDGTGEQPKPSGNPFAPDLTMSREVADYVLRAVIGLLEDGYWPKSYTGYGPDDGDEQDYDSALVLRAADIVGRDKIRNHELLRFLTELDAEETT